MKKRSKIREKSTEVIRMKRAPRYVEMRDIEDISKTYTSEHTAHERNHHHHRLFVFRCCWQSIISD